MVCLFHGDYGPAHPAFHPGTELTWIVDANSLKAARNLGEAEAIQRHLLRGEPVSWCDPGYAWVDQDAVIWFYFAAFLFVILPYLIMRARWFRFEWQFGVGVVTTLILDISKTVGFFAVTQIEFDLNSVAALLTLIGYSVTDKVVVYDRIRENLGKYKTMPLRQLIDLSINQTLGCTVATSLTVVLSILPLALIGGEVMRGFGLAIIFGIVVGTSSSIFIASPILLFLGEKRLRPSQTRAPRPTAGAAAR
jgi:multidrug efflux pump subunit AcrB